MYELSYYNDILEIKDGNILFVEPDNIINYLIDITYHISSLISVADKLLELYNHEHQILERFIWRSQVSFIEEDFSKQHEL